MIIKNKILIKKILIGGLIFISGVVGFKYAEKELIEHSCNCSEIYQPSDFALDEYKNRKMMWSQEEPMPDEFSGIRYAGIIGILKIGSKYTHGALEGGLKCTSFIDAMFRKTGRNMPTRRFNSIYGTENFYNLDGIEEYFDYVDEKNLKRDDIVIGYGNPSHIGIILDPKTQKNISTNHIYGIKIDYDYFAYARVIYDKKTDSYIDKKPLFLRYKGCGC